MRSSNATTLVLVLCATLVSPVVALAQPAPAPGAGEATSPAAPAGEAAQPVAPPTPAKEVAPTEPEPEYPASSEPVPLEAVPPAEPASEEGVEEPALSLETEEEVVAVPSPSEMSARLEQGIAEDYDGEDTWTAPLPVFALHGYMRMRGELMDTFWLGRPVLTDADPDSYGPDPFSRFRPFERRVSGQPCVGESTKGTVCDVDTLQFANMRLRLSPEMNITEDVRVHATFDVLDNVIAGTAPISFYGSGKNTTFADTFSTGESAIVARRAWAEVRNRDLGELRFGRMPVEWGLGMRYNAGNGLDQDFSTDMDRLMGIVEFEGFYFTASYDFVAEGFPGSPAGTAVNRDLPLPDYRPALDGSQLDDVDQFSFSVARKMSPEEEREALSNGDFVLNGGLYFEWRHQDTVYDVPDSGDPGLENVSMTRYTPDLWGQLKWPFGRVEIEAAWSLGSILQNGKEMSINQFGVAAESEFRFLEDKLALHFHTGLASGDNQVEGLSASADYVDAEANDDRITTYSFHPSYQIDMILWRNIMRQVTGAYYFKPGISYDFVKTDFGELFGARLDVIWSRASAYKQTSGDDADLGVELNAKVYWRSEDGAELTDGYHASLQYGVLFPLRGLGIAGYDGTVNLTAAQQVRLVLGVVF